MARKGLTTLFVEKTSKPGFYSDLNGLYLQVSPTGSKSWVFRYRLFKKQKVMGLGRYPDVDMASARQSALDCRQLVLKGIDPIVDREEKRAAQKRDLGETFDECAAAFVVAHAPSWKHFKQRQQFENSLKEYVSPVIGTLSLSFPRSDTPHPPQVRLFEIQLSFSLALSAAARS